MSEQKPLMRAKMQVGFVQDNFYGLPAGEPKNSETVRMHAVAAKSYPDDGSDENNTFARFSPGADLAITIANPDLFDKIRFGQEFYVDFIPVETNPQPE